MSYLNLVVLVGKLASRVEIITPRTGPKHAKAVVSTSEFFKDRATGTRREVVTNHVIYCYNELYLPILELHGLPGRFVKVQGKMGQVDGMTCVLVQSHGGEMNMMAAMEAAAPASTPAERVEESLNGNPAETPEPERQPMPQHGNPRTAAQPGVARTGAPRPAGAPGPRPSSAPWRPPANTQQKQGLGGLSGRSGRDTEADWQPPQNQERTTPDYTGDDEVPF